MRTPLTIMMLLGALSTSAHGQDAKDLVKVVWSAEPTTAAPGDVVTVHADVTVEKGWYIYAVDQTENALPTKFLSTPPAGLTPGKLTPPPSTIKTMEYVGKLKIHQGSFRFSHTYTVAKDAQGELKLPVGIEYQVCSDVCLQPVKQEHTFTIAVKAPTPPPADPPSDPSADPPPGGDEPFGGMGIPSFDPVGSEHVQVKVSIHPARAPPGSLVELRFDLEIADTWHIYATNTPVGGKTVFTPKLPAGFEVQGRLVEPMSHAKLNGKTDVTYEHSGKLRLVQRIRIKPDAPEGEVTLAGQLAWQECDPKTCVDQTAQVSLPLTVAKDAPPTGVAATTGEAPVPPPPPGLSQTGASKTGADGATSKTGAAAVKGAPTNWLALFLASIAFGIAMLVMPCTYPMIPITVSLFSKGKTLTRKQTIVRASVYAGGIVLSFTLVGGLVQVLFGGEGQGAIQWFATNAWLNLAIGIVFVYFAFSFFGYYELGLPAPLQRLMQLGTAKQTDDGTVPLWSLFLMGFFFVLTSYTCGAPVVLGLFATAASAPSPIAILTATFVFAVTVAAPFFVLALVPSGVRLMPKSGSWFSVFKVVLGFVELGFAVKFFRGTDLQFKAFTLLSRPVTLGLWLTLCVLAAVYLLGRFPVKFPHDPPLRPVGRRRTGWAILFLIFAGYFGWGLTGQRLHPDVEAFILEDKGNAKDEHGKEIENTVEFVLPYRTDLAGLEAAKAKAKAQGPEGRAFLLFTGHT